MYYVFLKSFPDQKVVEIKFKFEKAPSTIQLFYMS